MCDFLDMNGKPIRPFDKIEFWSGSYKEWVEAEVMKVESVWERDYAILDGKKVNWPVHRITITVKPNYQRNISGRYYGSSHPQKLRKSENIRKV